MFCAYKYKRWCVNNMYGACSAYGACVVCSGCVYGVCGGCGVQLQYERWCVVRVARAARCVWLVPRSACGACRAVRVVRVVRAERAARVACMCWLVLSTVQNTVGKA